MPRSTTPEGGYEPVDDLTTAASPGDRRLMNATGHNTTGHGPGRLARRATEIAEHLHAAGFDPATAGQRQVLALAEEVGEFVGAYRRWSGQARRTGTAEDVRLELADVVITPT